MKKTKPGFTLLEVILVVAIATLLFMSVVIGIGSRIATGRYETASTEIADYLRDVYTVALNTENTREGIEGARNYCTLYGAVDKSEAADKTNTGKKLFVNNAVTSADVSETDVNPGRTNCAIYGKALYFGTKDGKVHIFDVVGNVVTNNLLKDEKGEYTNDTELKQIENKPILEQLDYVRADIFAAIPDTNTLTDLGSNCRLSSAGAHTTYEPNWGALFKTANFKDNPSKKSGEDFVGMVMIVRAPATGNVHTFFYETPGTPSLDTWAFLDEIDDDNAIDTVGCSEIKQTDSEYTNTVKAYSPVQLIEEQEERADSTVDADTVPKNTGFCIGSDDFYVSISNLKKYVEFIPGGQNASAVKLNETTDKDGGNPCYN